MTARAQLVANTGLYVVADTRETAVLQLLRTELQKGGVPLHVQQITVGDYLICGNADGETLVTFACVERKTWADLAASLNDGRYRNVDKLERLCAQTGCQLVLLLEGPAWPRGSIHRTDAARLRSAVDAMQVRHGLHVVQTPDAAGTASRLHELARSYARAELDGARYTHVARVPHVTHVARVGGAPADTPDADADAPDADAPDADADTPDADAPDADTPKVPLAATQRADPDERPDIAVLAMWSALPNIAATYAALLARTWTLASVARGEVSAADVAALRAESGRALTAKAKTSLSRLRKDAVLHKRVLAAVHGVSDKTALALLGTYRTLGSIAALSPATLAMAQVPRGAGTMSFGEVRAARVLRLLHYVVPVG